MKINDAIVAATARLQATSDTPALDAQVLMAHALGKNRTYVIAHANDEIDPAHHQSFVKLIEQRAQGTPIAYITGQQEFWSLPLKVTEDTLIPRPETELLVELALEIIPADRDFAVTDIATGSGAIALAIASERKHCRVIATDASAAALAVARTNADQLGLTNIEFREGRDTEPLGNELFNLVISNPPYIPESDPHLELGDVRFEPRSALAAGSDGMEVIRVLVDQGQSHLEEKGWLMIEHGYDQEHAVGELFKDAGYQNVECIHDLSGQPRATIGQKPGT